MDAQNAWYELGGLSPVPWQHTILQDLACKIADHRVISQFAGFSAIARATVKILT